MRKSNDVLILSTYFLRGTAAHRRISYFINFLARNNIGFTCIGFKLISNRGVLKPTNECLTYTVPLISSASSLVNVINIVLSIPLILYIVCLKPRIILVSVPDYSILIPSYIGAKIVNAKFVVDMRDPPETSFYNILTCTKRYRLMTKLIIFAFTILCDVYYSIGLRAHLVTVVTNNLKTKLEKRSLKNVVVAPNGADLALFKSIGKSVARRSLGIENDAFLMVYAGISGAYHDLTKFMILVRKLSKTCNRKIKLVVAGPIVDKKHRLLINSPALRDVVIYFGELDTKKLIEVLSASDIGIVPLIASPIFDYAIPVKFYEYIALGLPVLALCNKNSELCRLVKENGLGFACRPEDTACFKRSLEYLMSENVYLRIKINVEKYRNKVDRAIGARVLLIALRRMLNRNEV